MIKGSHHSEEAKEKLSESLKGNKHRLGIPCSKGAKRPISESLLGNKICLGRILSEETRNKISKAHIGKKLSEETKIKMRGHVSWNKGKSLSEETRNKISEALKGKTSWNKGKIYSQISGSNHHNWKGGISSLVRKIRTCFQYRQWRSDVFTRDDFVCQKCGKRGCGELNAHHIKSFFNILQRYEITTFEEALKCEELWNINNGITLCEKCHKETYKGVKNIDPQK